MRNTTVACLAIASAILAGCGGAESEAAPAASAAPEPVVESSSSTVTDTSTSPSSETLPDTTVSEFEDLGPLPELIDVDGWVQSDVDSFEELEGKVLVVHIWTFGCINCKRTLPNLQALYEEHQGEEFEIVGIHSPEFEYEEDPDAILAAAEDLGVTWPIVLDTRQKTFFGWQGSRGFWPRTYVVDRDGIVRFDHIGEGAYEELNSTVETLLG